MSLPYSKISKKSVIFSLTSMILFSVHPLYALDSNTEPDIIINHNEILTADDIPVIKQQNVSPQKNENWEITVEIENTNENIWISNTREDEWPETAPQLEWLPEGEETQLPELSLKEKIKRNNKAISWEIEYDEMHNIVDEVVDEDQYIEKNPAYQRLLQDEWYFPLLIPTDELLNEEQAFVPNELVEDSLSWDESSFWDRQPLELPEIVNPLEDKFEVENIAWYNDVGSGSLLSWDVEDEIIPLTIELSPTRIEYNEKWLPLLETVNGVRVEWEMPYCSMMTRLNLQQFYPWKMEFAWLWSSSYISRGDAITLIEYGITYGDLTQVKDVFLNAVLDNTTQVAHDLYIYKSFQNLNQINGAWIESDKEKKQYILQGHRVLVFKANDEHRYVLDTLRWTKSIAPQKLSSYIAHSDNAWREYYLHTDIVYDVIADMTQDEEIKRFIEIKKKKLFWELQWDLDVFICEEKDIDLVLPSSLPFDDEYMINFEIVVWIE